MDPDELSNSEMTADLFVLSVSASWPGLFERFNTPLRKLNKKLQDLAKEDFALQEMKEKQRFFKAWNDFASKILYSKGFCNPSYSSKIKVLNLSSVNYAILLHNTLV